MPTRHADTHTPRLLAPATEHAIADAVGCDVTLAVTTTGDGVSPSERATAAAWPSRTRRDSWLRGRAAVRRVLDTLDGGGATAGHARLSVSHSGAYTVAIGTTSRVARGIGVDLEVRRAPAADAARFFLNEDERRWALEAPAADQPKRLLRLWTIKEALFKSNPSNQGTHVWDYRLDNPERSWGTASLRGDQSRLFRYCAVRLAAGYLSVAVSSGGHR